MTKKTSFPPLFSFFLFHLSSSSNLPLKMIQSPDHQLINSAGSLKGQLFSSLLLPALYNNEPSSSCDSLSVTLEKELAQAVIFLYSGPVLNVKKLLRHPFDPVMPILMALLGITGAVFIFSAQGYRGGNQASNQCLSLILGALVYAGTSLIDYKFFLKQAHWLYILGLVGLLLLWSPLGEDWMGVRRWIDLGIGSAQPSEPAKVCTLLFAASVLARSRIGRFKDSLQTLIKVAVIFALPIMLIFLEPDLGSALVLPPMAFALLYVSGLSQRFFALALVAFVAVVSIVGWDIYRYSQYLEDHQLSPIHDAEKYAATSWIPLHDYQRNRILSFVAPQLIDPQGIGVNWNLRQSLIAIGSGGLTGKGYGQSTQAKLGYLPAAEASNDFIFAVIGEEKGLIGGLVVLGLYAGVIFNCLRIAETARDRFGMLLCVGIAVIFCIHILVNIGMTLGLMPITGIPLPLVSHGGSFVLSCCFLLGLAQSVYRFRYDFS